MRVLITGGYGFIGAWIIRNLLARGAEVWVYDLREDARRLRLILPESAVAKVTFVPGDVTDLKALSAALAAHRISHLIHLAGLQVPTCRADPMLGAKVNVLYYNRGEGQAKDVWVVYKNPKDITIRSAEVVVVCKRTGRVLYEGSAGDEG